MEIHSPCPADCEGIAASDICKKGSVEDVFFTNENALRARRQ